jgi:hypothetical protein
MTEHEENQLLCERLLGWVPCQHPECVGWFHQDGKPCLCTEPCPPGTRRPPHARTRRVLPFDDAESGSKLLEKLARLDEGPGFVKHPEGHKYACDLQSNGEQRDNPRTFPTIWLALRWAAIQYVNRMPH